MYSENVRQYGLVDGVYSNLHVSYRRVSARLCVYVQLLHFTDYSIMEAVRSKQTERVCERLGGSPAYKYYHTLNATPLKDTTI